jgi:hypothetical protein
LCNSQRVSGQLLFCQRRNGAHETRFRIALWDEAASFRRRPRCLSPASETKGPDSHFKYAVGTLCNAAFGLPNIALTRPKESAVANFFTPASQKAKDRTTWTERSPHEASPATLLVAKYVPDNDSSEESGSTAKRGKIAAFDLVGARR